MHFNQSIAAVFLFGGLRDFDSLKFLERRVAGALRHTKPLLQDGLQGRKENIQNKVLDI